jgi:hypothetical protein
MPENTLNEEPTKHSMGDRRRVELAVSDTVGG